MSGLDGKVALITGGSSGIGKAAALALARSGARVVIASRDTDQGEEAAAEIGRAGAEALFVQADVGRTEDNARLFDEVLDRFGQLDVAFNNVGIAGKMAPFTELEDDDLGPVFDVNVRGMYQSMIRQMRHMAQMGGGVIVNNASINGLRNQMFPGMGLYTVTKHAVVGLTKAAALEGASHNIRINAVAPGPTRTQSMLEGAGEDGAKELGEKTPMSRTATPEEIANAVLYLASDASSYVTGHILAVDGGYVAA